ncbi:Gamma-aminobutyric acid receptor subunit beta-like 2, partial [Homarus americanus]
VVADVMGVIVTGVGAGSPYHLLALTSLVLTLFLLSPGLTFSLSGQKMTSSTFQRRGPAMTESFLLYRGAFPALDTLTICLRVRVIQPRSVTPLLSYAVNQNPQELLMMMTFKPTRLILTFSGEVRASVSLEEVVLGVMYSVCLLVDLPKISWVLVKDGHIHIGDLTPPPHTPVIRGGGLLYVGQTQTRLGGGFNAIKSLRGSVVDLRLYNHTLSTEAMVNFTSCKPMVTNAKPFIEFTDIHRQFEVSEVDIEEVEVDESFCSGFRPFSLTFRGPVNYWGSVIHCGKIGGSIKVPANELDNKALVDRVLQYEEQSGSVWVGVVWEEGTHAWRHHTSNIPLQYTNFSSKWEVSDPKEKCVSVVAELHDPQGHNGAWLPTSCYTSSSIVCHLQNAPVIRVRGLCKYSLFDLYFYLTYDNGNVTITGQETSEIIKHPPSRTGDFGTWEMRRLDMVGTSATVKARYPGDFPFGLNTWTVKNDVCGQSSPTLILTTCKDMQFTCSDGSCVEMRDRCDLKPDCKDWSDESLCSVLSLPSGYSNMTFPPRTDTSQALIVTLELTILHIRDVDLPGFELTVDMVMKYRWRDSRLKYRNLKDSSKLNRIEEKIWTPNFLLQGAAGTSCEVMTSLSKINVVKSAPPLPDDLEYAYRELMYSGEDNPLVLMKKITVTSLCQFNLFTFPFDQQRCEIAIGLLDVPLSVVTLDAPNSSIKFVGERRLRQYFLTSESMVHHPWKDHSILKITLTLDNLATYFICSTYVPTFTLVTIGYFTLYFPLDDFSDRVMVCLTTLLVVATFFAQTNNNVPQTSYVKLVDVWYVFCILLLFLIIITIIFINWLLIKEQNDKLPEGATEMRTNVKTSADDTIKPPFQSWLSNTTPTTTCRRASRCFRRPRRAAQLNQLGR